jgi:hypothetical protein
MQRLKMKMKHLYIMNFQISFKNRMRFFLLIFYLKVIAIPLLAQSPLKLTPKFDLKKFKSAVQNNDMQIYPVISNGSNTIEQLIKLEAGEYSLVFDPEILQNQKVNLKITYADGSVIKHSFTKNEAFHFQLKSQQIPDFYFEANSALPEEEVVAMIFLRYDPYKRIKIPQKQMNDAYGNPIALDQKYQLYFFFSSQAFVFPDLFQSLDHLEGKYHAKNGLKVIGVTHLEATSIQKLHQEFDSKFQIYSDPNTQLVLNFQRDKMISFNQFVLVNSEGETVFWYIGDTINAIESIDQFLSDQLK